MSENCVYSIIFWSMYAVPAGLSPSSGLPPGLVILEDFVTEEEEKLFLTAVDWESTSGG